MAPRAVSVIIVNYNSGGRLAACLEHLGHQSFVDFDVTVVDNASSDDSLTVAERTNSLSNGAPVRVLRLEENRGFAAANNIAARGTNAAWIALINPDAYPESGWLSALVEGAKKYTGAKAFGSLQIDAGEPSRLDGAGDVATPYGIIYRGGFGSPRANAPAVDKACFSPCAAAALYHRETFAALGGFDERFFCYGEDVDFGFRLRNRGGQAMQIAGAVVRHEGSGVSGRRSDFTTRHGTRNRIWLFYKNMPGRIYWGLAPVRLVADAIFGVKAAIHGAGGAYFRGLFDGYRQLSRFSEDRRQIKTQRRAANPDITAALTWSPIKLWRRAIDLREIPDASNH